MNEFRVEKPGAHLDQMIRQTRAHHVQLSQLADVKASVLLTTAALVVPLTLNLTSDPGLRIPALIMIGASLVTVCLAGYGTMPKFGRRFRRDAQRRMDLLFFADFAHLEYEEWLDRLQPVMNDPSFAYETQLHEIYQLGRYLERAKYLYIRLAYAAFIGGVTVSSAAWLVLRVVG